MSFSLPSLIIKEEPVESIRKTVISKVDNYAYVQNMQNLVLLPKLSAADRALIRFIVSSM